MPRELLTELPENPTFEDYKRFDGTLYVKNHSNKAVSANTREHRFILNPAGHDGDCQPVPEHALKLAGFQKAVLRGQLSISPNYGDYSLEGIYRQDEQRAQQMAIVEEMTEENSSIKDLVQKSCLVCNDIMFQPVGDVKAMVPPLCPLHLGAEHNFVASTVQNGDGTSEVKFALKKNPNRS